MSDQFPAHLLYYSSILTHLQIEVSFLNSAKMDSAATKDSDKELLAKLYSSPAAVAAGEEATDTLSVGKKLKEPLNSNFPNYLHAYKADQTG